VLGQHQDWWVVTEDESELSDVVVSSEVESPEAESSVVVASVSLEPESAEDVVVVLTSACALVDDEVVVPIDPS
jgi:hypothetical protein